MSRTQATPTQMAYTAKADAARRHENGVSKNKKAVLTSGGRAWSEDEESYLVQTRLQKMPYKHIAAHLKKTELACRLHYHQLTHGSGRRKRSASLSSRSDHSPERPMSAPGQLIEGHGASSSPSRRFETLSSTSPINDVQLHSTVDHGASRLPAILPKPTFLPPTHSDVFIPRYSTVIHEEGRRLSTSSTHQSHHLYQRTTPPPVFEGRTLPLPSTTTHTPVHVDLSRLQAIYDAHRHAFWTAIAHEYGANMSPAMLETAWKTGVCCPPQRVMSRPLTPAASPEAVPRPASSAPTARDRIRIASIIASDEELRDRR
ncbi:hypothetical protein PT974_04879 [Cladobotryum mycophilum]|uniref:Myb-like domain-containing protein n=1 Tax=Cladobotryum mycophilum TaxID=491253 RepID=A0ABR0SQE9_9HYPO